MFNISHELKMMLLTNTIIIKHVEQMDFNFEGKIHQVPAMSWNEIKLELKHQPQLFNECEMWYNSFLEIYEIFHKIDVGQFKGLWPSGYDRETMIVNFLADEVIPDRKNWKDWFKEGVEHASQ